MTCLERGLKLGLNIAEQDLVEDFCPSDYNIMPDPEYCRGGQDRECNRCWRREIHPFGECGKAENNKQPPETEAPADARRHFETGAVRDDATGKGRFDLLPWGAIHALARHCERGALHYGERNIDKGIPQHSLIDSGIRHLALYVQGDTEAHHLVAALWNIAWACEQELKRPQLVDLPERSGAEVEAV